jgi:hypothetical protein
MARISRGWRLAKQSWSVLKADRSLALFPVLSFFFGAVAFVILIAPGAAAAVVTNQEAWLAPFALLAGYAATFLTIYFNVALAAAASLSLDGKDTTLQDGLAVAREKRGIIAKWAAVQFVVGLVIRLIENAGGETPVGRIVAGIVAGLIGAAWAIATFFVVPLLAFEGVGPGDALKRSGSLIRERWGEGLVGTASISVAVLLVILGPALLLGGLAAVTIASAPAVAVAAIVLLVLVVIAASVIGSALSVIFRVALYRYASGGAPAAGFPTADLEAAFAPRRRRR